MARNVTHARKKIGAAKEWLDELKVLSDRKYMNVSAVAGCAAHAIRELRQAIKYLNVSERALCCQAMHEVNPV